MAVFGIDRATHDQVVSERQEALNKNASLQAELGTKGLALAQAEVSLGNAHATIQRLEDELAAAKARQAELTNAVEAAQGETARIAALAPYSEELLRTAAQTDSDQATQDEAMEVAVGVVRQRIHDATVASVADDILDQDADAIRAEHGADVIAELDKNLRVVFEHDGTFEDNRRTVETEIRGKRTAALIAAEKQRILDELNTPEAIAAMKASLLTDPDVAAELATFRQTETEQRQAAWEQEAISEGEAAIAAEIAKGEAVYKQQARQTWRDSIAGAEFAEKARADAEATWKTASDEEVAKETGDAILAQYLQERADALKKSIETSVLQKKFEGKGIDLATFAEGTPLVFYFGERTTYHTVNDAFLYVRRVAGIANGDGSVTITTDSLSHAENPYAKQAAYEAGRVVYMGQPITKEGVTTTIETIRSGSPVVFCDKQGEKGMTSIQNLVNILVDGKTSGLSGITYIQTERGYRENFPATN